MEWSLIDEIGSVGISMVVGATAAGFFLGLFILMRLSFPESKVVVISVLDFLWLAASLLGFIVAFNPIGETLQAKALLAMKVSQEKILVDFEKIDAHSMIGRYCADEEIKNNSGNISAEPLFKSGLKGGFIRPSDDSLSNGNSRGVSLSPNCGRAMRFLDLQEHLNDANDTLNVVCMSRGDIGLPWNVNLHQSSKDSMQHPCEYAKLHSTDSCARAYCERQKSLAGLWSLIFSPGLSSSDQPKELVGVVATWRDSEQAYKKASDVWHRGVNYSTQGWFLLVMSTLLGLCLSVAFLDLKKKWSSVL